MGKNIAKKNEEKLKLFLAKQNDTQPNSSKTKKPRPKP
jgi:hypothetical protein